MPSNLRAALCSSWLLLCAPLVACETDLDEPMTTGPTTADTTDTAGDGALGCALPEEQDSTDGMTNPLQETWGSACSTDDDCIARIGPGAVCELTAVVFELPGGYCTKPCSLPDMNTRVVPDDPACDPNGGIACVGQMGAFENCAPLCTDDAQCNRDGYICRQMPLISQPEDASLCLMPDCCEGTCDPND